MQRVLVCQFVEISNKNNKKIEQHLISSRPSSYQSTTATRNCLTVFQVEKTFRQIFTKYLLSLSCLYALRGSSVQLPLDETFTTLLRDHLRGIMWEEFHKDSELYQQQLQQEEEKFHTLKTILTTIYDQHGIPRLTTSCLTPFQTNIKKLSRRDGPCPVKMLSCQDVDDVENEENITDDEHKDDDEDYDHVGGAVSKILTEVSNITRKYQQECDQELVDRLRCRQEGTNEMLKNMYDRRVTLFLHIINNSQARSSKLTKSFINVFQDVVPVIISPAKMMNKTTRSSPRTTPSPPTIMNSRTSPSTSPVPSSSTSWISRWITKEPPIKTTEQNFTISRWMGVGNNQQDQHHHDHQQQHNICPYPIIKNEVVLFSCSCWQSYSMQNDSAGAGGLLYVTEHYIGLVGRAVLGLSKRKELFFLKHLKNVSMWKSSTTSSTTSCSDVVVDDDDDKKGGILQTLAAATGLSYMTTGCKLTFEITPEGLDDEQQQQEDDQEKEGHVPELLSVDVFVIPAIQAETLQLLLMEAKYALHSDS